MRVPYAPSTPAPTAPTSTQEIYTRIAARRAPRPLIPLDLALLHNPSIADGWNSLLGAIRSKSSLDPGLMELAICRVAVVNGADYEWFAHSKLALEGGVSRGALGRVLEMGVGAVGGGGDGGDGVKEGLLSEVQLAVIGYTDAMTREVKVSDAVFERLRGVLGETEIVELTATVAGYNCVSRFLVALDVGEWNGRGMVLPE